MADDVIIQHPTFEDQHYTVPADEAAEWEAAGWTRVKRSDEAGLAGQVLGPPSGPVVPKAQPAAAPTKADKT